MCVTTATICQRECQEKASTIEWCICSTRKCSLFLLFCCHPVPQKWTSAQNQLYAWTRNSLQIWKAFLTFRHAFKSPEGFQWIESVTGTHMMDGNVITESAISVFASLKMKAITAWRSIDFYPSNTLLRSHQASRGFSIMKLQPDVCI